MLKELLKEIKKYNRLDKKLNKKKNQIKEQSLKIDFQKETQNLTYEETKLLKKRLEYRLHRDKLNELEKILKIKKEREYPEITGVIYYPELKELNLSQSVLVQIDRNLQHYSGHYAISSYNFIENIEEYIRLSEKTYKQATSPIIKFLLAKNIIEKKYLLGESIYITQEEKDRYYDHWAITKEQLSQMNEEELEKYYSEDFSITVTDEEDEDNIIEIKSINEFEKNITEIKYKIIKQPDYTLDMI